MNQLIYYYQPQRWTLTVWCNSLNLSSLICWNLGYILVLLSVRGPLYSLVKVLLNINLFSIYFIFLLLFNFKCITLYYEDDDEENNKQV